VGYLLDSAFFNSYSTTDLTAAWDKVYAELATYSQDLQAVLLGSLTYVVAKTSMKNGLTVATNANASLFQTLFASQAIKLETIVGYAGDGNANDDGNEATQMGSFGKFIYTIVGLDGGTGYTANINMLTDGLSYANETNPSAPWGVNSEESAMALDWYGLFKSTVGQAPPADFAVTKAWQDEQAEAAAAGNGNVVLEPAYLETLSGNMQMAVADHIKDVNDVGGTDGINVNKYVTEMKEVITHFTTLLAEGHSVAISAITWNFPTNSCSECRSLHFNVANAASTLSTEFNSLNIDLHLLLNTFHGSSLTSFGA
jgi:hypothetical protein